MIDDVAAVVAFADSQGWQVTLTNAGHYRLYPPEGGDSVTVPNTPSDWRSVRNSIAELRRHGLEIPRKTTPRKRFKSNEIEKIALAALENYDIELKLPPPFPHITEILGLYRNDTWFDSETGAPLTEETWGGPTDTTMMACILADYAATFRPLDDDNVTIFVAEKKGPVKLPNQRTQRIHFDTFRFWVASHLGTNPDDEDLFRECSCGWHCDDPRPAYFLADHIVMRHERAQYNHFPVHSDLRPWADPYTISKLFDEDERDIEINKLSDQVKRLTEERDEARETLAQLRRLINGA